MIHEAEVKLQIELIKSDPSLPSPPPSPRVPNLQGITSMKHKVEILQRFMTSFQYNYSGQPFVKMIKSRGMSHISSCAKEIIRIGLPIQCMEAVFLGCFLTAGFVGVDRLPLSFKSKCESNTHRHIVLALRYDNKWGAIGLSRRSNLMFKDIAYPSLCDLIQEYKASYAACGHRLIKIYIGLPFSHDIHCDMAILWRVFKHTTYDCDFEELRIKLDSFTSNMLKTFEFFRREGVLPSNNRRREAIPSQVTLQQHYRAHSNSSKGSHGNESSNSNNQKRSVSTTRQQRKSRTESEAEERKVRGRSKSGGGDGGGGERGRGGRGRGVSTEKEKNDGILSRSLHSGISIPSSPLTTMREEI
jgi:tubulinyl-Tyr carboxypeptidase